MSHIATYEKTTSTKTNDLKIPYKDAHPKCTTQYLQKLNLYSQSQKLFQPVLWLCFKIKIFKYSLPFLYFFICIKHFFIPWILCQSHLIKYSDIQSPFEDAQRTLKHSKHLGTAWVLMYSNGTWVLGHSESAQRALEHSHIYSTRSII